jgi:hypothetical protein
MMERRQFFFRKHVYKIMGVFSVHISSVLQLSSMECYYTNRELHSRHVGGKF